jgi:hypothetical protein
VPEQSEPSQLERLTKPAIVISAAAAVLTQLWVRLGYDLTLALATTLACAVTSIGGRRSPQRTRQAVMFLAFLVPAIFLALRGEFDPSGWLVWIAAVLGLILQDRTSMRWKLPPMWRIPLAHWALVAAVGWPLVMLRESDFDLGLIPSAFGALSAVAALVVMTGVLWFDWMYGVYRSGEAEKFRTEILWPMSVGWLVSAAVAMRQAFGHMGFLNPTFWSVLGRVSGSMADANLFGVISAMFGPLLVALALDRRRWRGWWLAFAVLPVSWLAVWASGSRSSMPLVVIGAVSLVWGFWRSSGSRRVALMTTAGVAMIAVVVAVLLTQSQPSVVGPFARFNADFRPRLDADWVVEARNKLFTRDGYGVITSAVIRESPIVGIGIGAFNPLVYLHSWQLFHRVIPADNAQNWFRHEFAELGALGSVGWIGWVTIFVGFLVTARVNRRHLTGAVLRGLLIGLGLISLVGVPGQSIAVALMFWTFVFAFAGEADRWKREGDISAPSPRLWWALVWILVVVYAAAMVYVGMTFLRPPLQAMRAGLNYASGFYPKDDESAYSWTGKRAVTVVPVSGRWLDLELIVNHPDAHKNPVDVKVFVDGRLTVSRSATSSYPITGSVELKPGADQVLIETWVSRVSRPSDFGGDDTRELGMAISWKFVDRPGT